MGNNVELEITYGDAAREYVANLNEIEIIKQRMRDDERRINMLQREQSELSFRKLGAAGMTLVKSLLSYQ